MEFVFQRETCQNIRKSLRKEWLETNGKGDYASSTLIGCNTRRYHGLLVASLTRPEGRHVLLSALEESLVAGDREFFFSCRRHPGLYWPRGHEYLHCVELGQWPQFLYHMGDIEVKREILMIRGSSLVILRYTAESKNVGLPPLKLVVKPLLAYRNFHSLTQANIGLHVKTWPAARGFKIEPYEGLPPMFMQVHGRFQFFPSPDWYHNVEYLLENERGFPFEEDLFQPGIFEIDLVPGKPVYVTASLEELPSGGDVIPSLWRTETKRRVLRSKASQTLEGQLACEGEDFLVRQANGALRVLAGYHWFDAWGRDTMIALPGLTVLAGRADEGREILLSAAQEMKDGLLPNCYEPSGNHAWNSADASLWYVWAVQRMASYLPDGQDWAARHCLPAIVSLLTSFSEGRTPHVSVDDAGLLHVGDESTQFTWMDAMVQGKPVTPRWGCAVELNALWYNAWAFACELARRAGETPPCDEEFLKAMAGAFMERFWVGSSRKGYLADVWRPDFRDESIRPNQLFAVGLPFSMVDQERAAAVMRCAKANLLAICGLRTLSPRDANYRSCYTGNPEERDRAYHQGTVWPWLLGIYGDVLWRTAGENDELEARGLLETLTPLFEQHLANGGMGSISEVFDGSPPHIPGGCIAQAWSVAECLRLLLSIKERFPELYGAWERGVRGEGE